MIYFDRIDVSKELELLKEVPQNSVMFVIICIS